MANLSNLQASLSHLHASLDHQQANLGYLQEELGQLGQKFVICRYIWLFVGLLSHLLAILGYLLVKFGCLPVNLGFSQAVSECLKTSLGQFKANLRCMWANPVNPMAFRTQTYSKL